MSSSDPSVKPYHGGYGSSHGYSPNGQGNNQTYGQNNTTGAGQPVPTNNTTIIGGSGTGSLNYSNTLGAVGGKQMAKPMPPVITWDPIGPTSSVTFYEEENGVRIVARLEPDPQISAIETMRIMLLTTHYSAASLMGAPMHGAKPISYIRSYNLERHFRFSTQ